LNGRPITKVVEDGESTILTPNHFLIGNLGGAVSTRRLEHPKLRWQVVQSQLKKFWESFLAEYIVELGKARKWQKVKKNVKVGDLVLEIKPDLPQGQWNLAVVSQVIPSADGLVRKIMIRCHDKEYSRPITQLAPLDFNIDEDAIL
jgi:hypothetical protein